VYDGSILSSSSFFSFYFSPRVMYIIPLNPILMTNDPFGSPFFVRTPSPLVVHRIVNEIFGRPTIHPPPIRTYQ
jgi:hypothetical protein